MDDAARADMAITPDSYSAGQLRLRAYAGASLDNAKCANARARIDFCAGVNNAAGVYARLVAG